MKYVSIDLETTGLDPARDQILQIGAVVEDTERLDLPVDVLPNFNVIVRHDRISGSPFALKMNASLLVSEPEIGLTLAEATEAFFKFLEAHLGLRNKWVTAGKNFSGFDKPFLATANSYLVTRFHHRSLDPTMLYLNQDDVMPPDLKLCVERAGVPARTAHDALADARTVVDVLRVRWPR